MQPDSVKQYAYYGEKAFAEEKTVTPFPGSGKETDAKRSPSTLLYYYTKFMILIGILGQSLYYLQAFKIYMKGSAQDVSLEGFLIAFFSLACWLIYGILIKDKVLIIVNIVAVFGAGLASVAILSVS